MTKIGSFGCNRVAIALSLAAVMIVGTLVVHHTTQFQQMKARAIGGAERLSDSLARVIDDQMQRSLQSLAIVAENIAERAILSTDKLDLGTHVDLIPSFPELRGLIYVRPDFSVIAASHEEIAGSHYLSSPEYARIVDHLAEQEARSLSNRRIGYLIGKVINGRQAGGLESSSPPFIPVSREVRAANGSLLGYLVALVNVPYLEFQYRSLTEPHGARVYIASYDGLLLATTSHHFVAGDDWAEGNPVFKEFIPLTEHATFRASGSYVGRDIVSFRVTRDWPIVVAVAISEALALSEVNRDLPQSRVRLLWMIFLLLGGLALIGRYLAEIEQKDESLARQQATLQNTLEHMSDGLVAFDASGRVVAANARILGMTGSPNVSGGNIRTFLWRLRKSVASRSDRESVPIYRKLGQVLRGRIGSAELSTRNGRRLEVRSSATPDGGRILLVNDVTVRREQEEAIRRSEVVKNAVIASALDCIIVIDSRGFIREFNPAAERTFGWRRGEIIGRALAGTIMPEVGALDGSHVSRVEPETAEDGRVEVSAVRRSGEVFPCEFAITPINDGHEALFTAYLRDISARKKAEREVMAARESAEQASQAKSEFLAHISHEIRTPMNAIVGYASLALEDAKDGEQRLYAEGISDAAKSLLTLVNDVLDLSRLEAGRMSVVEEPFSLARLVTQIADTTRILIGEKDVRVLLECGVDEGSRFKGDPDRIRQIMLNLAGNAAKFTERGKIVIAVSTVSCGPNSERLHVAVADTGIGVSDEAKPRIFGAFEQDGSRVARRVPGTGLGLAISRSLARLMGGDITFESVHGVGATFRLVLPLVRLSDAEPVRHKARRQAPNAHGGLTILVAEDTPASQMVMTRLLERRGFRVVVAADGAEAVQLAQTELPDAIFMDVQMPKMDGLQATRRIRKLAHPVASVRIVALTAQAFSSDREHCRAAGMDDFLAKPVLPDLLDELLARTFRELPGRSTGADKRIAETLAPAPKQAGLAVFNSEPLRTMMEDVGMETAVRILKMSRANAAVLLDNIEAAMGHQDQHAIKANAHALSGLLRQFGLDAGGDCAASIETSQAHADTAQLVSLRSLVDGGMLEAQAFVEARRRPGARSIVA